MTTFSFLVKDHSVLTGPYGSTHDTEIAEALIHPLNAQDVFALERKMAGRGYHAEQRRLLENFVAIYIANRNAAASQSAIEGVPLSPPQFWSHAGTDIFEVQEQIRETVINEFTSLYEGEKLEVIRVLEVARFPIPVAPAAPAMSH